MRRSLRALIFALGGVVAVVLAAAVLFLYAVRTEWFQNRVRQNVVSTLERTTGGRVELGRFDFDWRALTIELDSLIIHGTESASDPPLVSCPRLRIGLRIISFFGRSVRLNSLVADQPKIALLVRSDGSTNIPALSSQRMLAYQLADLRISHYALQDGVLRINDQQHLFGVRGEGLEAGIQFDASRQAYALDLDVRRAAIEAVCCNRIATAVAIRASLARDRLQIEKAEVVWAGSKVSANGEVSHFAAPRISIRFTASAPLADLAQVLALKGIRGGVLRIDGIAQFDTTNNLSVEGQVRGSRLVYRPEDRADVYLDASSDFRGSSDKLQFENLTVGALGGLFKGQARMQRLRRRWDCEGTVRGFSLQRLAALYSPKPFPASGVVGGNIALTGSVEGLSKHLLIRSSLGIDPGKGRMPVSGRIDLTAQNGSGILFSDSHLNFPRTQMSFSGSPDDTLHLILNSQDIGEIAGLLPANSNLNVLPAAKLLPDGSMHFAGTITALRKNASAEGALSLRRFEWKGDKWDLFESAGHYSCDAAVMDSFRLESSFFHARGDAKLALTRCQPSPDSPIRIHAAVTNINMPAISARVFARKVPILRAIGQASIDIYGTPARPRGSGAFTVRDLLFYGEPISEIQGRVDFTSSGIELSKGLLMRAPHETASFAASYRPRPESWQNGQLAFSIDTTGLAISPPDGVRNTFVFRWKGELELHAQVAAQIDGGAVRPVAASGRIALRKLALDGEALGEIDAHMSTNGDAITLALNGDLRDSKVAGAVNVSLSPGTPIGGKLSFDRLGIRPLAALLLPRDRPELPLEGSLAGRVEFAGLLEDMSRFRTTVTMDQVALKPVFRGRNLSAEDSAMLALHNTRPIRLEITGEEAAIRSFEMAGRDTSLQAAGSFGFSFGQPVTVDLEGSLNLGLIRLLDPTVDAVGTSSMKIAIRGTAGAPSLTGKAELKNAAFSSRNFSNVLNSVNGTISFNNDRATLEQVTAETGGGHLRLGGFVAFGGTGALAYRLEAHAEGVRLRYARRMSTTSSADLRLTGTSASGLLSGTATVSRIVLDPNADFGGVLADFADWGATPTNREGFLSGLHLDIGIESAPNFQLSTQLSRDVEAEMSLRLRGTPAQPILQGGVSINQGDIRVFGARYTINRGDIQFVNTSKLEPVLDLDLQTQARGIDVNITISGTINKLNVNYRSDPPLQPRDIVALLTVGRTPEAASNVQSVQAATTDTSALQSGANTVLGQAISPAPSRLSKLFGITNIKIDPLVQGITNTPQSRLTLEEQISRAITITYITNLAQTSEQIFRLEWALNRQYSVVAIRDDNGEFGIDIQYKKRFK